VILDKDHTKEYKRARNELKKRSSDTLRLQKKAKKGTSDSLQSIVDASMSSVNQQKAELDEVERKSLRSAMIEDRTRYCHFVNMLQPVVKQEYEMMYELGHLQVRKIPERISSRKPSITFFKSPGSNADRHQRYQRPNSFTSGVGRAHCRVEDFIQLLSRLADPLKLTGLLELSRLAQKLCVLHQLDEQQRIEWITRSSVPALFVAGKPVAHSAIMMMTYERKE
jgi:IRSp53/MIM homology domain